MIVWVYCICHNEALMMPYFLRHYGTFADKIIVYDDRSDDGTRDIIASNPKAALRDWPHGNGLADDEFLAFSNNQWKEARGHADWVAWVDADEFLYHPAMRQLLEQYLRDGVQIPQIQGFGMVSNALPSGSGQIYDEIRTGFPSPEWNKHELFQPTVNMTWNVGRHSLNLESTGPFKSSDKSDIKLLHYRYLGLDYVTQRALKNVSRQPDYCKRLHYGDNNLPEATKAYSIHWFKQFKNQPFPNII